MIITGPGTDLKTGYQITKMDVIDALTVVLVSLIGFVVITQVFFA